MNIILIALIGALASIMANKGIAVFNDGLRPIMPEHIEGRMSRKELAATSFAMSFGLVIGFGIPFSLTASIILIHSILLGTDIIGTSSPDGKKGLVISGIIGALYGAGILLGLESIVKAFELLPVNFMGSLGEVGAPIVIAFAAFPALATGYQYGAKKGLINLGFSVLARQLAIVVSPLAIGAVSININPEGSALIVGMIILIIFAVREKSDEEAVDLVSVFGERVKRIKKNVPYLMVMGGLVAAATAMDLMAGDPISLNLLKDGKAIDAGFAALARGIGFIPLIASTAIATGVYAPVGMTFVFAIGLFIANPIVAAIAGALVIGGEVLFLDKISKLLDKFPGVRKSGDNIRTAMSKLLEIALLVGGMNAANAIAPGIGFFIVIGLYILNEIAGKPVVKMAVGPISAIIVGILVNILSVIGLFTPPA
ncbi:YhfT family protein [Clostridium sp. D2Q-11]|uniref:YhfT family protein n=1 Tax=Anaeromonas frigoriresistens TaxID=2683708 RepID=A0A942UXF9_9FIRM|nr:YhfT family protein [Anaeromonas frigoriresistens]MBS4538736.1 YhfT family protein [Anaeromonas frigoriresistens]